MRLKANIGRGQKSARWVGALHLDFSDKFDRLRKAGVKFSFSTPGLVASDLLSESVNGFNGTDMIDEEFRNEWRTKLILDGFSHLPIDSGLCLVNNPESCS